MVDETLLLDVNKLTGLGSQVRCFTFHTVSSLPVCLIYIKVDIFLPGCGEDILGRALLNFSNCITYACGSKSGGSRSLGPSDIRLRT